MRSAGRKTASGKARRHRDLIQFVKDRPGHDQRYAIDASKIERDLGWVPRMKGEEGMRQTVDWYLANRKWWSNIRARGFSGARIGLESVAVRRASRKMKCTVKEYPIAGLKLITPKKFGDNRGFFSETYNAQMLAELGIHEHFVQDNHSLSVEKGTVRGLHYQNPPHAQAKLVRVSRGSILDVAVDIRRGSPTYGQHMAVELSAENWNQLLHPSRLCPWLLHHRRRTPNCNTRSAIIMRRHSDAGILWNDPALGIAWPEFAGAQLSPKESLCPALPISIRRSSMPDLKPMTVLQFGETGQVARELLRRDGARIVASRCSAGRRGFHQSAKRCRHRGRVQKTATPSSMPPPIPPWTRRKARRPWP